MTGISILVGLFSGMVNFLLALGAYQLVERHPSWWRLLLVGLLAGVYAALATQSRFSVLGQNICHLFVLLLLVLIGFGTNWEYLPGAAIFVLLRLAMDGIDERNLWPRILLGALIVLLCQIRQHKIGRYAKIVISNGSRQVTCNALLDTGNSLFDPVSGKPVLVVGSDVAEQLLDLPAESFAHPLETMMQRRIPGLRLIPYSAVGTQKGMLLAMAVDQIKVNGKTEGYMVAFAPQVIGQGCDYQALVGGFV